MYTGKQTVDGILNLIPIRKITWCKIFLIHNSVKFPLGCVSVNVAME